MKTIVTHISLDLDAITACWLIKRFLPGWDKAEIAFVAAGKTLNNDGGNTANIIHVDTGLTQFDHHQTDEYTSAAKLVFNHLLSNHNLSIKTKPGLERLINFVNDIDHFAEVYFPDSTSDRYEFLLSQIIEGLKNMSQDDQKILNLTFPLLDAILALFKNKVNAEAEIKKGFIFKSHWGKSLALESKNEEAVKLALKMHFALVIRKDPLLGHVRIKTLPEKKLDLTPLYQKIIENDRKGTWFLHISKNMLLNSSAKNPHFIASPLPLQKIIAIVKSI